MASPKGTWCSSCRRNTATMKLADHILVAAARPSKLAGVDVLPDAAPAVDGGLQAALRPLLLTAQIFAVMPVEGILQRDSRHLRFRWRSYRVLYSFIGMAASGIMAYFVLVMLSKSSFDFKTSVGFAFYLNALLASWLFLRLAQQWPRVMRDWTRMERQLSRYPRAGDISKQIRTVFVFVMATATVEHILSILSTIQYVNCARHNCTTMDAYFHESFVPVFQVVAYARWKGAICQVINALCTFNWNFVDLFIMVMGLALSEEFKRVNLKITTVYEDVKVTNTFWADVRLDYTKVAQTCRSVNNDISALIILSFCNNLYFILIQLLHSVEPRDYNVRTFYFFYSLLYLLARTIAVTLYASKVSEQSVAVLPTLFAVPRAHLGEEIGQFVMQIHADPVAITGARFFTVTRFAILAVAGTIATYELVLIQYVNVKDSQ